MNATRRKTRPDAFSLIELMAALMIVVIVAAVLIPRATSQVDEGNRQACFVNKGEVELQAQLWRRNKGTFPAANLSDVGADLNYFPEELPTCPVDGTAYTIDTTTGHVIGHTH